MSVLFRYSMLDAAHKCLRKYKLQYIDKVATGGSLSIDLQFGTAIHCGIEAILENEDGEAAFKAFWDALEGVPMVTSKFNHAQLKAKGEMFLSRFLRLHKKNYEPLLIEQTLQGRIGEYEVQGTFDAIGMYKGKRSVIDFKTSNYAYTKEKILINEQMFIYDELLRQHEMFDAEQLVYCVFVKSEDRIQHLVLPLTDELRESRMANVEAMCQELTGRTNFPMNPNSCMMGQFKCPYFNKCHKETADE